MRIRQVKPAFWSDVVTARLIDPTDPALFYIGLWMQADDAGYLRWNPPELAAELYPYVPVEEREAAVLLHKVRLEELGRLRVYKCGHAVVPSLPEHQHLAGPTHRVYTFRDEHSRCKPRRPAGSRGEEARSQKGIPAGSRGSPPRLGQVRLGQVRLGNTRTGANGATMTEEEMDRILEQD